MIIYGTEVKGPFYPEKLSTLPVYTASDEGRVVYVDDVNKVYYGSDSALAQAKAVLIELINVQKKMARVLYWSVRNSEE